MVQTSPSLCKFAHGRARAGRLDQFDRRTVGEIGSQKSDVGELQWVMDHYAVPSKRKSSRQRAGALGDRRHHEPDMMHTGRHHGVLTLRIHAAVTAGLSGASIE